MFEFAPTGGRPKRPTKKQIERLKRGHIIADAVRQHREMHHEEQEVPKAEEELAKELEEVREDQSIKEQKPLFPKQ
jgi:hypothetical protein